MAGSRAAVKKIAWREFSLVVRMEEALQFSGSGVGQCCTCGDWRHYKSADAGHFIPGRGDAILFERTNVHFQCPKCNRFEQGKWVEYEEFMLKKYGREEVDRLKALKKSIRKYSEPELSDMVKQFRKMRKIYEKEIGET